MSQIHVHTTVNGDTDGISCVKPMKRSTGCACVTSLGLTGAKEGCGTGDCGACSVTVDGRLVCSCLMLGAEAEGRKVETIEGMADGEQLATLSSKSSSIMRLCNVASVPPGSWWRPRPCLDHNPDPSETEVRYWLAGNLCRCTGYDKIIRAVMDAAAEMRGA